MTGWRNIYICHHVSCGFQKYIEDKHISKSTKMMLTSVTEPEIRVLKFESGAIYYEITIVFKRTRIYYNAILMYTSFLV